MALQIHTNVSNGWILLVVKIKAIYSDYDQIYHLAHNQYTYTFTHASCGIHLSATNTLWYIDQAGQTMSWFCNEYTSLTFDCTRICQANVKQNTYKTNVL